jgi:hypothetical protein
VVSFIYMQGSKKGTRREVSFISRKRLPDGGDGFTGVRSAPGKSGKTSATFAVAHCREMYIPEDPPGLRGRQISLGSDGSDAI